MWLLLNIAGGAASYKAMFPEATPDKIMLYARSLIYHVMEVPWNTLQARLMAEEK